MTAHDDSDHYDVVVVGAGFSGMYLVRKLRDELGLTVRCFERGEDVGGTWYWNRYPGARCDVESTFYSYSFDEQLQQEWSWSERFARQPEILAYLNHVADRFGLRDAIRFETVVLSARFDDDANTWTVSTDRHGDVTATYLISAVGNLSSWQIPSFDGLDSFRGSVFHTGDWPREGVDFAGRRVAVVGTGSSGIQSIPMIAEHAAHLTVFQRTAQYTVPARNRPLSAVEHADTKALYPMLRQLARRSPLGVVMDAGVGPALETDPLVVETELERRWWRGGGGFTFAVSDTLVSVDANEVLAEFVRKKIRGIVRDPDVAALLEPHEYPIGAKRMVIDTEYYETYNRPNVELVSIRDDPIERISPNGIVVAGLEREFDAIVFATGFDAMTGSLLRMDIQGVGGRSLREAWAEGPKSYLGVGVAGFPNLFTITGPGSPSVLSNMIVSIEQHVDWIADYLRYMRGNGIDRTEVDVQAQDDWVEHVNKAVEGTLMLTAASWYMGANIPGKPRVFMPYSGGVGNYRATCDEAARTGYPGFIHRVRESHDGGVASGVAVSAAD